MATVTLYHFTSAEHIGRILEARELRTTESNISFKREHAGPAVVWLTTHTDASAGLGLTSPHVEVVDKSEVRVTVEIDKRNAHKWREWARRHGSSPETIQRIAETGGGAASWRVTTRPIPITQWREIRNMHTGQIIRVDAAGQLSVRAEAP
ncbi:MAG: hypothetical protein ACTHWV_00005 [Brachybacterium sp.]